MLFAVVVVVIFLGNEPCLKKAATGLFVLPDWLDGLWLGRALLCDKGGVNLIDWLTGEVIV